MPEPGKVFIYNRATGEQREHWPIDAREIVQAEGSEWQFGFVAPPAAASDSIAANGEHAASRTHHAPRVSAEELNELTKDELVKRAEKAGLTVTRADGEDGEPLKSDYVKALSA